MALESGTQLGHYQITEELGKGGMGEVYRARDTKLGREVAIKVLPSEFSRDEERLARLEREARMLAALNHPNIAAIHGLEESDNTRFLVLELVEGDTLADRLEHGAIPIEESLKLALQIAEALEAAHEKGVIHRDLKPANIKITPEGRVKVLDFGLAKAFIGDQADVNLSNSPTLSIAATQAGIVLGTAAYMSPEQASGEVADKRADIWSFGVVLFEMLTGRQLFTGKTVSHVLADVLRTEPDWSSLPASIHPRTRILLERSLEKESRDRLSSISDARVELRRALAEPAGTAGRAAGDEVQATGKAQRKWIGIAVATTAVVVTAIAWLLTPQIQPPMPNRFVVSGPTSVPPIVLSPAPYTHLAISPDGQDLVYNANEQGGFYWRPVGQLQGRELTTGSRMDQPFFSPDGEWVGFGSIDDSSLKKMSVQGGPAETITSWEAFALRGASWGQDDIVFASFNVDGLMRVAPVGGDPEIITTPGDGEQHLWPDVLPNRRAVLFTILGGEGAENQRVAIKNLETGEERVLIPSGGHAVYAESGHIVYAVQDTLRAVPFDADRLEVLGDPVPVVEGVATNLALGAAQFDISSNGSLVYVSGESYGAGGVTLAAPLMNLTVFNRDGNRRLVGAPVHPYHSPRVSPDGRQIAVEIWELVQNQPQISIWIYDIGGGSAIRRLTQVSEGNNTRPLWTPDGERITFASDREGRVGIYWQMADGSGPAEALTMPEEGNFHIPYSWSPDGVLAFGIRRRPGGTALLGNPETEEIWTLRPEREAELFYDLSDRNQFGAAFSPDGRWLAYTSAESLPVATDEFRIFVGAFPGNSPRYEIIGNGAAWPMWSADGTELFYRLTPTASQGIPTLNSVRVETEGTFRFSTEESVFVSGFSLTADFRDFDPLPDGSGFLMLTPADNPGPGATEAGEGEIAVTDNQVVLVQNFFEVLKSLVPVP